MQLTKNFSLAELIHSNTAIARGINNTPNDEQIENLKYLAENVLQPIRDHFNEPIRVSSGYRGALLNRVIRGSATSHHSHGCAADIDFAPDSDNNIMDLFLYIYDNLPFTELILEEPKHGWIHVAIAKGREHEKAIKLKKVGGPVRRVQDVNDIIEYWNGL